ncbi:MAG: pilus assembly FimT family protein [Planctomycetota bacterium]
MIRRAFTLIEMLVVIALIAMLSGMVLWLYEEGAVDEVDKAAQQLATTIDQARIMALRSGYAHAVVFHIENVGDGRVLQNFHQDDPADFPGRHWYAIIGPATDKARLGSMPPQANDQHKAYQYPFLTSFQEATRAAQIGKRMYLPRGVRFLALSDWDDGVAGAATYPRPWHGWFDASDGRLYPWGGYHRDMESGSASSDTAFGYQGRDGAIPYDADQGINVNPGEVWGQIHADATARNPGEVGEYLLKNKSAGDQDNAIVRGILKQLWYHVDPGSVEVATSGNKKGSLVYTGRDVQRTGPDTTILPDLPRPLIDGYLADHMLLFDHEGRCLLLSGQGRAVYFKDRWLVDRGAGQVDIGRDELPMRHDLATTGGYQITICRDIDPEDHIGSRPLYTEPPDPGTQAPQYDRLDSIDDAYHTIFPYARIFVPVQAGDVEIRSMQHPEAQMRPQDLEL